MYSLLSSVNFLNSSCVDAISYWQAKSSFRFCSFVPPLYDGCLKSLFVFSIIRSTSFKNGVIYKTFSNGLSFICWMLQLVFPDPIIESTTVILLIIHSSISNSSTIRLHILILKFKQGITISFKIAIYNRNKNPLLSLKIFINLLSAILPPFSSNVPVIPYYMYNHYLQWYCDSVQIM